ncbi:MAG TPA: reverse transcriptase family protein, partial [Nitrososphaeraceae archaeon]|nr:reverse transcriptase family protein [Nitrososphaeraceae archaeon]
MPLWGFRDLCPTHSNHSHLVLYNIKHHTPQTTAVTTQYMLFLNKTMKKFQKNYIKINIYHSTLKEIENNAEINQLQRELIHILFQNLPYQYYSQTHGKKCRKNTKSKRNELNIDLNSILAQKTVCLSFKTAQNNAEISTEIEISEIGNLAFFQAEIGNFGFSSSSRCATTRETGILPLTSLPAQVCPSYLIKNQCNQAVFDAISIKNIHDAYENDARCVAIIRSLIIHHYIHPYHNTHNTYHLTQHTHQHKHTKNAIFNNKSITNNKNKIYNIIYNYHYIINIYYKINKIQDIYHSNHTKNAIFSNKQLYNNTYQMNKINKYSLNNKFNKKSINKIIYRLNITLNGCSHYLNQHARSPEWYVIPNCQLQNSNITYLVEPLNKSDPQAPKRKEMEDISLMSSGSSAPPTPIKKKTRITTIRNAMQGKPNQTTNDKSKEKEKNKTNTSVQKEKSKPPVPKQANLNQKIPKKVTLVVPEVVPDSPTQDSTTPATPPLATEGELSIEELMMMAGVDKQEMEFIKQEGESDFYITIDGDKAYKNEIIAVVGSFTTIVGHRFEQDLNAIILQLEPKNGDVQHFHEAVTSTAANSLLHALKPYHAALHKGLPVDTKGQARRAFFRINVYGIPVDLTIEQLSEILEIIAGDNISNIRIFKDKRPITAHFSVNSALLRDFFLHNIINLKINDTTFCPLEESAVNFVEPNSIYISNLPVNVLGKDFKPYMDKYLEITKNIITTVNKFSTSQNMPLKPFQTIPIPTTFEITRYSQRSLYGTGYGGDAIIQFKEKEVVQWLTKVAEAGALPKYKLESNKIYRQNYPRPIIDPLAENYKSKFKSTKYTQLSIIDIIYYNHFHVTNFNVQTRKSEQKILPSRSTRSNTTKDKVYSYIPQYSHIKKKKKSKKIQNKIVNALAYIGYKLISLLQIILQFQIFPTGFFMSNVYLINKPKNKFSLINILFLNKLYYIQNALFFNFISEENTTRIDTGFIQSNNLKIISVNIAGELHKRVNEIKKYLKQEKPQIMCLLETHTHYEEYKRIKGLLETNKYKILFTAAPQKEYYENIKATEIEKIKQNNEFNEWRKNKEILAWESNSKLYSNKYKGGIILIIENNISHLFQEVNMIPNHRGITLISKEIEQDLNIFLHFIYAPAQAQEATKFWNEVTKEIIKKQAPKNKHYIIGDLNAHIDPDKTQRKEKIPKGLKEIMKTHNLIDTYGYLNKDNQYTFMRIEPNNRNTVKTRVDYILAPMFSQTCWCFPKIYRMNQRLSRDHKAIGITLNFKSYNYKYLKKETEYITKKILIKDLSKERLQKIEEELDKEINWEEWELVINLPENKVVLETLYFRYISLLWNIINKQIPVKESKNNIKIKPPKPNKSIEKLENQEQILCKMITMVEENITNQHISNKLKNYNDRLIQEYKIDASVENLNNIKQEIYYKIHVVREILKIQRKEIVQRFITQRVEEIRDKRINNPTEFFKKAQPDNMFNSQQLWTVEYEITKNNKRKIITTSNAEIVKKKVKEAWETVFLSGKRKSSDDHTVFHTKKFKEVRKKIKGKDQTLVQLITMNELDTTIKNLSNNTSPGPDRIPNEIIKIFSRNKKFKKILLKILNTSLVQKKTPGAWKSSHIFTVYKKKNPNNPLNYRPIALLNTTYKIYSSIITSRLSEFMENNNCFSNMQGGFRRDRPTYAKIWGLKNIIEHSIRENRELHVTYIDIQKAYDSVEFWALELVLEKYGFNTHFIDIISDICRGTTCNVILPYGLSNEINITRGVRQGCPLSPVLFIMYLEPIMLQIEESNRGYTINNRNIPGAAYVDDMVLHTNRNSDMQILVYMVQNYFDFVGLQMAADGRDKTIYTNNLEWTIHDIYIKDKEGELVKVPFYESSESYKYLGLWINLDLNWKKQEQISNFTLNKSLAFLYKKCFNATQTIEILNLVVFPAITYRMNFMYYNEAMLKQWDKQVKNLVGYKLRENQNIGSNHWILPFKYYGYG